MKLPISFALGLAAAAMPGAAFAQGAHSDHQHGVATAPAAPAPQVGDQSPMMQGQQGGMSDMAMASHGKDCHCCCCEMMGRHGEATGADSDHADHDEHQPPSK